MDGPGGLNYELVKCNLDLDPTDGQFQLATTTSKFPEYPVAFHCDVSSVVDRIFTCNSMQVNAGGAMGTDGIFTVPLDGVYLFTFSGWTHSDDVDTIVNIRSDGLSIAYFRVRDDWKPDYGDEVLSGSAQAIIALKKDQKVDSYLSSGYITGRFTGHLLYAT